MSDNERVVIESDTKGRIAIHVEDANGAGHGYRLAGPKFNYGGGKPLARVVLDERDVQELRIYLRLWDEIQESKRATEKSDAR